MAKFIFPAEIQVAGVVYKVEQPEQCSRNCLGWFKHEECLIEIAKSFNYSSGERPRPTDNAREVTFYHEITHAILHIMGRYKLNEDEGFVDAFASLLAQAMHQVVDCQLQNGSGKPSNE